MNDIERLCLFGRALASATNRIIIATYLISQRSSVYHHLQELPTNTANSIFSNNIIKTYAPNNEMLVSMTNSGKQTKTFHTRNIHEAKKVRRVDWVPSKDGSASVGSGMSGRVAFCSEGNNSHWLEMTRTRWNSHPAQVR